MDVLYFIFRYKKKRLFGPTDLLFQRCRTVYGTELISTMSHVEHGRIQYTFSQMFHIRLNLVFLCSPKHICLLNTGKGKPKESSKQQIRAPSTSLNKLQHLNIVIINFEY